MKVCIIGCGYVGLTACCALSSLGHNVYCYDKNDYRITNLSKGNIDIYEPNLAEALAKNINSGNLKFITKFEIENDTDIFIIAVGTPEKENGEADTKNVEAVLSQIVSSLTKPAIIINKSTVPVGTAQKLKEKYKDKTTIDFEIVSNPEFLSQGSALNDFLKPRRIIIGSKSKKAIDVVKELYSKLDCEIITMDENSAELAKYACNSFLAVKLSFINEISNLAYETKSDINSIIKAMTTDERIGKYYFKPGIGYGGSCLPKDTAALVKFADALKVDLNVIKGARITNESQKRRFISDIMKHYHYNIESKVFCIWGLSFKPNTNDTREAPSNTIIDTLLRYGATVRGYDPKAKNENIEQYNSKEEALINADALIVCTEWDEFLEPDFEYISSHLTDKIIFDARNIYIDKNLSKYNLKCHCIGKNNE